MKKLVLLALALAVTACKDSPTDGGTPADTTPNFSLHALPTIGSGLVLERYTAEIAVRGQYAYTTTWGFRNGNFGTAVKIWNIASNTPVLTDSLIIPNISTTSDVQISADGKSLVVSFEGGAGTANGIAIYDLTDPGHPDLTIRYNSANTANGVHTVKLARINNRDYAFLSIDPRGGQPAKLVITDITNQKAPTDVFVQVMGNPYIHDVFVRDGYLFTAEWEDGVRIWDVGGGGQGGSPSNPVQLGSVKTVGGAVHNIWWFYNPNGQKKYAFIGEENSPSQIGLLATGDIHVVDVSNKAAPKEVAFFHADSTTSANGRRAGVHNFSMDESNSILYAAYYNGGVRALNVSGDLSVCTAAQKAPDGRCDLGLMGREVGRALTDLGKPVYIWGVQYVNGKVYASDMLNGIETIDASALKK